MLENLVRICVQWLPPSTADNGGQWEATICGVQHIPKLGTAVLMTALLLWLCEVVAANEWPPKCGVLLRTIECLPAMSKLVAPIKDRWPVGLWQVRHHQLNFAWHSMFLALFLFIWFSGTFLDTDLWFYCWLKQ